MKKKLLIMIVGCVLASMLIGCSKSVIVDVKSEDTTTTTSLGTHLLVEIGGGLWYDSSTGVVYWWNGVFSFDTATTPTPYYSSNGLLYKYIPETNTFEEINK